MQTGRGEDEDWGGGSTNSPAENTDIGAAGWTSPGGAGTKNPGEEVSDSQTLYRWGRDILRAKQATGRWVEWGVNSTELRRG